MGSFEEVEPAVSSVGKRGTAAVLLAAVALMSACGSGAAPSSTAPATTSASAGSSASRVAICTDTAAGADNASAVQAAWDALPPGLRTGMTAKGFKTDGGAYGGQAPAAVISGLAGQYVTAELAASDLGSEAAKYGPLIIADLYVALVNKNPAFAAGTKPADLVAAVRARQGGQDFGKFGVNVSFLSASIVSDLNTLYGTAPADAQIGAGEPYVRELIPGSTILSFFPVRSTNGTC
ncbi:hypothetical protein [Dactylosporangium sp. CA-233914]|uniref:hypothetical protein n=1 Tax=Dactylosporangium sp. CA-233914 TaxID=3239934 RepID=UPI003D940BE3